MLKKAALLFLIVALNLFVVRDYLAPGLPGTDDGLWAPVRLGSMYRELIREHQFPVRWSGDLNYGYGYPLFQFSYPGLYYIAALAVPFDFGLANIVKACFIIGIFLGSLGVYVLLRTLTTSSVLSLSGVLLYLAAPAVSTNLYLRGSIGEIFAAGLLPWLLLLTYQNIHKRSRLALVSLSILLAFFITVHNTTALLSLPFILTFAVATAAALTTNAKSPLYRIHSLVSQLKYFLVAIMLGVLLASFFWLPAIVEIQYTKISQTPLTYIQEWFLAPSKTFLYPLFADQGPDNLDAYHLSIGLLHTLTLCISIFILRHHYKQFHYLNILAILLGTILLLPWSLPLWHNLPLLKSIDFPWRILSPLSVMLAVTLPLSFSTRRLKFIVIFFSLAAFWVAIPWMHQKDSVNIADSTYATNPASATANNEYFYKTFPQAPASAPISRSPILPNGQIESQKDHSTIKQFLLNLPQPQELVFAYMYFPGWHAYLDDQQIPILHAAEGQLRVSVPAGEHQLIFRFERTPVRIFAEVLSLFSLIVLLILASRSLKR